MVIRGINIRGDDLMHIEMIAIASVAVLIMIGCIIWRGYI